MSTRPATPISEAQLGKILSELRSGLTETLGETLEAVYLFGSHARGDAEPGSDIDVLVLVKDDSDYGDLMRRTSQMVAGISLKHDVVISRAFVSQERFEHEQSPFMLNVRREGVPV